MAPYEGDHVECAPSGLSNWPLAKNTLDLMDEIGRLISTDEHLRTKHANVEPLPTQRGFDLNNVLRSGQLQS